MDFIYYGWSTKGLLLPVNEDSLYINSILLNDKKLCFAIVCDGVGSLKNSDFSSSYIINNLSKFIIQYKDSDIKINDLILNINTHIQKLNLDLFNISIKEDSKIGTTLSLIIIYKSMYHILHIGDSRIYIVNKKELVQLTQDHIKLIDNRIVLTQCVGISENIKLSLIEGNVYSRDSVIVCTDGFYKNMPFNKIVKWCNKIKTIDDIKQVMVRSIKHIIKKNERDNISVGIIKYL